MASLRCSLWRRVISSAASRAGSATSSPGVTRSGRGIKSGAGAGAGEGGASDPFPPGRLETIVIDRSRMLRPPVIDSDDAIPSTSASSASDEPQASASVTALRRGIDLAGRPLSVATFMREALLNPQFGFYTRDRSADEASSNAAEPQSSPPPSPPSSSLPSPVFGAKGHFVTSPHISQIFGELCGIWALHQWIEQGKPRPFAIVEFGPGLGKLMQDLLRGLEAFPEFLDGLSVHMIEASTMLQKAQAKALGCDSDPLAIGKGVPITSSIFPNVRVSWHHSLADVALNKPAVFLAHEFLDALPIYKFQKTEKKGWCEVMVDKANTGSRVPFQFTLSPGPTPAALSYISHRLSDSKLKVERQSLTSLEYCPEAALLATRMADHIGQYGGGALLVDYGEEGPITDSLMGIRNHEIVDNILEHEPGSIDLSADVDFGAIRLAVKSHFEQASRKKNDPHQHRLVGQAAASVPVVSTHGPISQRTFLERMGIYQRLNQLIQGKPDDVAQRLYDGVERLVSGADKNGMGERYKVMAMVPATSSTPAAFEA